MFDAKITRFAVALVAVLTFVLAITPIAGASVDAILKDCNDDGALGGSYSPADLKNALGNIPADLQQYSNCESVIQQALLKKVTDSKSPSLKAGDAKGRTASVNALTTPAQRARIRKQVEKLATIQPDDPIVAAGNPAIQKAAGNTLASSKSPAVPVALVIAVFGLLMLFGIDLAGRMGKIPRVQKLLPKLGRRGDG